MQRIIKAVLITLCLSLIWAAGEARAGAPTEAVRSIVDEVVRILKDANLENPAERRNVRRRVKAVVDRRFDYEEMAQRSLGPTWNKLSGSQRQEFTGLFAELLEASYSDKIEKYSGETVRYVGESQDGKYAEVRTMLVRRNDRIPINYKLINKSSWVIYDVVIEGVSQVSNYRSQFRRILSQGSYADLVQRLRTKVSELRQTSG
jgi:phospholipid transport system substrate-binding protein